MPTLDISLPDFETAVSALPTDGPVVMANLLRFRDQAEYGPASEYSPCGGAEAYLTRYLPAFDAVVQPLGGSQLLYGGTVAARLLGPANAVWDAVGLVQYPSIDVFRRVLESPDYQRNAAPHRRAALADWQLFATTALG
ncbi:DUF1330 domain-containing protein [Streptomyces sp. NPDC054933]